MERNITVFRQARPRRAVTRATTSNLSRPTIASSNTTSNASIPHRVATEVRKLLIDLLPTGKANQQNIAGRLNKSVSTLQRQLSAEGTTFREIQDETRQALAEEYVLEGKHSLSQIAYLLGFSDQSNFSRAFKRWSGATPSEYQATRTD